MPRFHPHRPSRRIPRRVLRGLSLIELLIFVDIVAVALSALLRVFVQATSASADPLPRRQARMALAGASFEDGQLVVRLAPAVPAEGGSA